MEIRTKFKPEDKISVIDYFEGWEVKWSNVRIIKIEIVIYKERKRIKYYIETGIGIYFYEGDCFSTKEEAQKECERRNGKD